jgi:hypothetical protein
MYESYIEHCNKYWEKDTTIDRIDVNGNYSKENCKRSTMKEQQNNRTNTMYVVIDWIRYNGNEYAEKYKIKLKTARYRMRMFNKWLLSYKTLTHVWKI